MARTLIYERSVQSVVIDANLYQQLSCPGNKVRIKEEPPDWDSDAGTESARERLDSQPSSSASNKENLCTSETRKKRKRKRNDYVRRRRSRVKKLKGKGKDGTLEKKSRDALRERERKRFNEIPGNLEDNRTSGKSGVSAKEADQKKEKDTVREAGVASGGKSASGKKTRRELECKECFLSFPNASTLERHERCYRNQLIVCTACNTGFYLKSSFLRHDAYCRRTKKGGKFQCHFCLTKFLGKTFLQSHLFHSHRNSIFPATEPATETAYVSNGKDPAVPSVPDEPGGKLVRSGRTSVSKVESAVSKKADWKELESGEPSAQPKVVAQLASDESAVNMGEIGSSFREKTGIRDTRQQTSTPGKKMRQTILTEFLRVSSKCCKDEPRSPAKDGELQPVGRRQEHALPGAGDPRGIHQAGRKRVVRPFVCLHASPVAMQEFLDRLSNMKDEPSDESPFQRENSPRSLRATRQSDCRAERVNEVSAKRRLSETAEASHDSSPRPSYVKRLRTTLPVERDKARPRPEPKLKDCFVPLLRCDAVAEISKHPESKSPLRSQSPGPAEGQEGSGLAELEKRRYQCKICKKRFFTKRNLIEHEEFFHVAYMSSICNARYTSKYKLLHHYLRQHTKFKRSVLCCVCEENFSSRSTLQRHLLLHCIRVLLSKHDRFPIDSIMRCNAFRKNHRCERCGKRFWLSSCLKQHGNFCSLRKQERSEIKADDDPPSLGGNTDDAGDESPRESERWTVNSSGVKNGAKDSATFPAEMPDKLSGGKKKNKNNNSKNKKKKKKKGTMVQEKSVEEEGKTAAAARIKNGEESQEESQMERERADEEGKEEVSSRGSQNQEERYSCRVCKIRFESTEKLSSHERKYFGDAKERCSDCGTAFPNRGLLQTHKKASHSETTGPLYKFQCKFCKQGFNKQRSKQMHEEHFHLSKIAVAPEQTWLNEEQVWNINTVCSICNLMFETYDKFLEHNIYYYKGHTFTCSFCSATFHGMYMLHHHNKLVHYPSIRTKSYSYLCDICNEGFNQLSHFHAHKLHVHLPDAASKSGPADGQSGCGPEEAAAAAAATQFVEAEAGKLSLSEAKQPAYAVYPCNICQLIFSNKTDFLTHQMEYSRNGNYLCNACDRRCRTFDILTQHYSLNHQDDSVPGALKCPDCLEVLTTSVSMLSHRKHFHPREADGRYELLAALERNVDRFMDSANHGKSRDSPATASLKCITCAMLFENMADLRNHLLDYSNIGDHSCAVCHRRFPQSKSLEEHKVKHSRLHTILAEHRCSVCQEGFNTPQLATAHVLHFHGQETFQNIFSKRITVLTGDASASADNASVLAKAKDQRSGRRNGNRGEFYFCDICQGSYSSEVILANHRQQHRLPPNATTRESNPASSRISAARHSTAEPVGEEERSASESVPPSTAARRSEKHSPARASGSQGRTSMSERPPSTTNSQLAIAGATDQPTIIQVSPSASPGRSTPHSTLLRNSDQALIRTNNAETVLKCSLCCLRFASESSFREHVEHHRMCKGETTRLPPASVPPASGETSRQHFAKPLRSLSADSMEDLKVIGDKNSLATDPAASLVQAVVNQETCPPSSGISSNGIANGSENRNLPRLKVKPLAKIIESLAVKNLPKSLLVNQSQPGP